MELNSLNQVYSSYKQKNTLSKESFNPISGTESMVVIKVGVVGDSKTGKTSLLAAFSSESEFSDNYMPTLGVSCSEKSFTVQDAQIVLSLWDLGGHSQYMSMLPLVCNEASAIIFTFDLTRRSTLHSVKQWYHHVKKCNKAILPVLVGTKYDNFVNLSEEMQRVIAKQARTYAQAMNAPLVFCSIPFMISIHKLFKIIISRLFDVPCSIPTRSEDGEPIIEY